MKKLLAILLCMILSATFILTSCGNDDDVQKGQSPEEWKNAKDDTQDNADEKADETEKEQKKEPLTEVSDDLYDFHISIDGTVYQFPCTYSDFEKNGWTFGNSDITKDTIVEGNISKSSINFVNGESKITITFANPFDKDTPYKDCPVIGVMIDEYTKDAYVAKGITVESTAEQIKNAFGEPFEVGDLGDGASYIYMQRIEERHDDEDVVHIELYTNKVAFNIRETGNTIEIEVEKAVDDSEKIDFSDVDFSKPQCEDLKTVSDNIYDFEFMLADKAYKLPCSLSDFTDNGWNVGSVSVGQDGLVEAKKFSEIAIRYDGGSSIANIRVYNPYDESVNYKNLPVVFFSYGSSDYTNAPLVLAKGVDLQSNKDEIREVLGYATWSSYEFDQMTYAKNGSDDKFVKFDLTKEGNNVVTIQNVVFNS